MYKLYFFSGWLFWVSILLMVREQFYKTQNPTMVTTQFYKAQNFIIYWKEQKDHLEAIHLENLQFMKF